MNDELREKKFNPKAHILTLLGDELIKSPVMAIYELVKNSYDADAKKVDVYFRDIEDIEKASIIIEDDGIGMTTQIIEDVWLEPGSDFRKPIDRITGQRRIMKSPVYKRIPMGEKGVGRFAVHKLSSQILVITRPLLIKLNETTQEIREVILADYEIQLYIDWKDFSQSKHLSDVPIRWSIKKDEHSFRFKNKSGTYIRLSGLKEAWTKGMARDLKGQTLSMTSPKLQEGTFYINLNFDNKWLADFPSVSKILSEAPFKITALISEEYDLDLEYEFELKLKPEIGKNTIKNDPKFNENIKGKVKSRVRKTLEDKELEKHKIEEALEVFSSQKLPFGNLIVELNTFDLDPISMRDYTQNADVVKRVLKDNSGIKVFKNDLRVYDYGNPGNDWLGLDLERIQSKMWFSNNNVIGYVYLDAEKSTSLIEKTNREGFVENEAFLLFYMVLKVVLNDFAATRFADRNRWLKLNQKSSANLFDSKISNFRSLIAELPVSDEDKKKRLYEEAEKLEEKYEDDQKNLLIPAGVGMTASVALHEIEKLIPRMQETLKSEPFRKHEIEEQVDELKEYTDGIISVLRKGGDKPIDVLECVTKAFNNYRLKLSLRKISCEMDIADNVYTINCDKRFFITILMNLIDNSIYWLDTVYKSNKAILIKAIIVQNHVNIIIADNGPGFKDDIAEIIRPFFSRKSDGIGLGMYLIDTIMMKYGKLDIITDKNELSEMNIPLKYTGAVVQLVFNKNQ